MTKLEERLDRHRAELSQCRRCNHADGVQPIVSMARSPKVMLVGQAPGVTEACGGRPFAGRAGKTLFAWLESAGIDEASARSRIYISAITRCYPGPSPSGRGDRVPDPVERSNCAHWLNSELAIIRPVLIIPVGRLAIDAFIGPKPLHDVIGREFRLSDTARRLVVFPSVVVPLPHPSGASSWIHAPGHKGLLAQAIQLIADRWSELPPSRRAA
jgi:uracil-DNA glycosylase